MAADASGYYYMVTADALSLNISNVTDDAANSDDAPSGGGGDSDADFARRIVGAIFLVIIIICAVVGNSLVCIAVMTQRSLRRSSNFFFVSLACSDLLVALSVMTFAGINDVKQRWIFGEIFCDIWISLDVMCCTASILNITAISFDRYLHIWKPYDYSRLMSPCRTVLVIVGVWLLSALISFLPIQLGVHRNSAYEPVRGVCIIDFNPIYAATSSIVSFFIPCIVMIIMFAKMYQLAQRHVKSIRKQRMSFPAGVGGGGSASHKSSGDNKASITLGVIMGVFLFCWFPFFTVNVITPFVTLPADVFVVVTWFGYINSMANPIIYTIFNKEFRNAFKKLLCIEKCCGQYDSLCCRKELNVKKRTTTNGTSTAAAAAASSSARNHKKDSHEPVTSHSTTIPLMNMQNNNNSDHV